MDRSTRGSILSLLLALAACDSGQPAPGTSSMEAVAGRVGVVLPTAAQPAFREVQKVLESALGEADVEIVVEGGANDPASQRAILDAFVGRKPRAIVVAPLDSTTLRPSLDNAANQAIPVFTIGLPVNGARVTTHVEPDYHGAGVAAAEYISAFLGRGLHAGVVGHLGAHGRRELHAGFQAVMRMDSSRVLAGAANSDGTREGAAAATAALLEKDPSLDAVFALDAASAQGALDAAYAQRRADLVIVSFGATDATLDAIREVSPLRAALVERRDEAARLLGTAIATQLGGEPVTAAIRYPVRLVTADSLK